MDRLQEKLQEYVQCLNLQGNHDETVIEALKLLKGMNSDKISENSQLVALLFCTVIGSCTEEQIAAPAIAELIWNSYGNVKAIGNLEQINPPSEVVTINFLNKLNHMCGMTGGDMNPVDNEMQEQYKVLCSKLEEMKMIFRLKINGVECFPIGKLLAKVIGSDYTFEELNEVTLITFLLALEIFDAEPYIKERNKLEEIIDKCNLKCIRHLSNPSVMRIGENTWKDNFIHNGVLILRDVNKRLIYIRHPEKVYFKRLEFVERGKLLSEVNSEGKNIAYYYEYEYDADATFISIEEIMLNGTPKEKMTAIKEIYNNKMYNVFFSKAFMKIEDDICPVNLFTAEDREIIRREKSPIEANVENVTDYAMKPFSLVKVLGKEFDFIIVGSICKLLTISNIDIDIMAERLMKAESCYQDVLVQSWLEHSGNILENMIKLQEVYFSDTAYIKKKKDIINQKIIDISWIPVMLPEHLLDQPLKALCNIATVDDIETVLLEQEEDFEGNIVYRNVQDDTEIESETITLLEKEDWLQENIYAVRYQERYFITREVDQYIRLMRKIADSNKGLYKIEDFSICFESQIQVILEAMCLQEKALKDIDGCTVDFDSIARMRIIHHIIYNGILQRNQWINLIEVINGHQQLKFDFAKEMSWAEDNIMVVPKERQDSDSALTSIINEYIRKNAVRNRDFYSSEIGLGKDGYTYKNQKIEKIMFLFDTLQSGTSTIRNLRFYFEDYDKKVVDNVRNQHMIYYCNNSEIKLQTIIEKNHPTVEVVVLYGSKEGKETVEKYLADNPFISEKTITCKRKIIKKANRDFMDKVMALYNRNGITIKENSFPVIREFNQSKKNAFPKENLDTQNIASIFVKKKEFTD